MQNLPNSDIRLLARQKVSNRVQHTGQTVPAPVIDEAADLLACLWQCGEQHGVTIAEWRAAVQLEQVCIDVLALR